jgi:hypothetical protein
MGRHMRTYYRLLYVEELCPSPRLNCALLAIRLIIDEDGIV